MAVCVRLPRLGENVVEGTVGTWRRREGEAVRLGEPLVEIITSKATFDVACPADGILRKILAPEKSSVPTDFVLAVVGRADEGLPDVASENQRILAAFQAAAVTATRNRPAGFPSSGAAAARAVRATPGARRLAKEGGVDLAKIALPPGRDVIREEDVRRLLDQRRGP